MLSDAMAEAVRVHARARYDQGSADERIDGIRTAIAEIGRIAQSTRAAEQGAILDLNESLYMLIDALEQTAGNASR